MLGGKRVERVGELILHELSQLVHEQIEFEPGVLVTLTQAELSADLEHAKVSVSILPTESKAEVWEQLRAKIGELQHDLNRRLNMQPVPKIRFVPDHSQERTARIDGLLDNLDKSG